MGRLLEYCGMGIEGGQLGGRVWVGVTGRLLLEDFGTAIECGRLRG